MILNIASKIVGFAKIATVIVALAKRNVSNFDVLFLQCHRFYI